MSLRGYLFAKLGRIDEAREALKMLQTLSSASSLHTHWP
jgi:hypothetical protein